MDSVTQLTLGAAVGELVLGQKIGNQAILWGALAGTLPDLDVLASPWLDDLGFLIHHRGITHSLLTVILVAPALAGLAFWGYGNGTDVPTFSQWSWLFFWCLLTHVLLDACTTYGTPLLLPFSDYRVAFNNIFIVDPLYTLPMLVGVLVCLLLPADDPTRRWVNYVGVGLSCLYLGMTFMNKYRAHRSFTQSLAEKGISPKRMMTGPTPLNSVLWYCFAQVEDGFYVGYHSLLDAESRVCFEYLPRNDDLLADLKDAFPVERLIWFANGYYAVRQEDGGLVFHVLKFGIFSFDADVEHVAFSYKIARNEDGQIVVEKLPRRGDLDWGRAFATLWDRIKGKAAKRHVAEIEGKVQARQRGPA